MDAARFDRLVQTLTRSGSRAPKFCPAIGLPELLRRELAGIALLLFALFLGAAIAFPGGDAVSCTSVRGPSSRVIWLCGGSGR